MDRARDCGERRPASPGRGRLRLRARRPGAAPERHPPRRFRGGHKHGRAAPSRESRRSPVMVGICRAWLDPTTGYRLLNLPSGATPATSRASEGKPERHPGEDDGERGLGLATVTRVTVGDRFSLVGQSLTRLRRSVYRRSSVGGGAPRHDLDHALPHSLLSGTRHVARGVLPTSASPLLRGSHRGLLSCRFS